MRFSEFGPVIPDLLLERRDAGRVVFFCGAGVSINSGMPTFLGLAQHIIEFFDPPEDSDIMKAFQPWLIKDAVAATSLDQIFHLLQQEYGRDEVNELVTGRLSNGAATSVISAEHNYILRISSNVEGRPQIVTTNFDLLFEKATSSYSNPINVPPSLPELPLGMPITGITYLHGRLTEDSDHPYPYVLSSADFGRAYLAEGWATNFVRSLLSEYTVVLVGYQAEDPPIRYLLQGLNHDGRSDRSNLYAFDKGRPEDIEVKWRDRGVTPIAYSDHQVLWETMKAWAERADNPRQWRQNIIGITPGDPKTLKSYERGQVAHLVRTTPGAKQFNNADPVPHPEWVCVLDAGTRAAVPSSGYGQNAEEFIPLNAYGLDDDPPRPPKGRLQTQRIHENLLEWNKGDSNPSYAHKIGGRQIEGREIIPSRLFQFINWIGKHLDSPAMAWWAARQYGLHPRLIETLKRQLRNGEDLHPKARRVWSLILEHQSDQRQLGWDGDWYDLQDRVAKEGWTQSVLRDFSKATKPMIKCSIPLGIGRSRPPSSNWDEIEFNQITDFEVSFSDQHGEEIDIPDHMLQQVVILLQCNLQQASGMLDEIGVKYFRTPTCYPDREVDGEEHIRDFAVDVRWFIGLFERLVTYNPELASAIASTWPITDKFFFRSLKLFAMNHVEIFDIGQAFASIQALDDIGFWDDNIVRELLFLIADRWTEFSDAQKIEISDKILAGLPKPDHLNDEDFPSLRDTFSARYGRWLILQGCELPKETMKKLDAIVARIPDWSDDQASGTVTVFGGQSGWVETNDSPEAVVDLPTNEVIERANADLHRDFGSLMEKRPFTGLVKANPRKALAALSIGGRRGNYPTSYWAALIQHWPGDTSDRLFRVFMLRLAELPKEMVRELRYTLGDWVRSQLPALLERNTELTWRVFDHCVSAWMSDNGASTDSGLGETRVGGEVINSSRRTYGHAINGPIGEATLGITQSINQLKLGKASSISIEFKSRLERLMGAPGEGGDHCIAILAREIGWLNYIDPDWVSQRLVPLFAFDHQASEPAWNGLLSRGKIPSTEILTALKELLTDLFPRIYDYDWDRDLAKAGATWLAWMVIFRKDEHDGLTIKEARSCLRMMNDATRRDVIFWLGQVGNGNDGGWTKLVIPFLNLVWPREKAFRTSASATSWISMLDDTDKDFPVVYSEVKKFLIPIEGENHRLYRFVREVGDKQPLTVSHPSEVLDLMDTIISDSTDSPPHELSQILELIAEADDSLIGDSRYNRLLNLVERV